MLDLHRLRLLRELHARGTIGAVAAALDYSPSAVSQQLAVLEREAGVALLERVGRNVRLTHAGALLVGHADALLARMEQAEAELERAAAQVSGTVRVASFQTGVLYLIAPALPALRERHPGLRVEVVEAEPEVALPALALGRLDMVLADEYAGMPRAPDPRLRAEPLLDEPVLLRLPAGHPLAGPDAPVDLRELRDAEWACTHASSHHTEMTVRTCRTRGGFEPDLRHRSNDLLILLTLVATAGAVTLLPSLVPGEDGTVSRPLAGEPLVRQISAYVRAGTAERPPVAALLAALRSARA